MIMTMKNNDNSAFLNSDPVVPDTKTDILTQK